jgi:hypothetical protein
MDDAKLQKLRRDSALPSCKKSTTAKELPNLEQLLTDMEAPS